MLRKVGIVFLLGGLALAGFSAAAEEPATVGRVQLGAVIKLLGTYRDRNEDSGVTPISELGTRWIELSLSGAVGEKVSYRVELVAANGLYRDPILGTGFAGRSSPGEFGTIGVRKAELELHDLIPRTRLRVGGFMPGWGLYQDRSSAAWDTVDLPLIYTHPAFRALGWQNTGLALAAAPLDPIQISLFWINGYFPNRLANGEAPLPNGGTDVEKGLGGRIQAKIRDLAVFGGYYRESWQEDLRGGPGTEEQNAQAWIAGAEWQTKKVWVLGEWQNLLIDHYQLKLNGSWSDLQSYGGHITAGWRLLPNWEVLVRWEWMDPNAADSKKTFLRSRFDQITQWTVGVNYRLTGNSAVMVSFVLPQEEGDLINLDQGEVGGRYQGMENNYLRLQFQVWQ